MKLKIDQHFEIIDDNFSILRNIATFTLPAPICNRGMEIRIK